MENEMVEIPLSVYNDLVDDQKLLDALRAAGVDNWQGWDDAIEIYNQDDE